MTRIKHTTVTKAYAKANAISDSFHENRDCTVIALSVACDVSYERAHEAMRQAGRKRRCGSSLKAMQRAAFSLGYLMEPWSLADIIDVLRACPRHINPKTITTHHPRRFPEVWGKFKDRRLLFSTRTHVLAVINAEVQDWSINRSKHVNAVYEITRILP